MAEATKVLPYTPIPVPKGFVAALSLVHVSIFVVSGIVAHFLNPSIPLYFIPMSAYITEVLAMFTHWAGHVPWINSYWYDAHMDHHCVQYPPSRFLRSKYQGAKKDNSKAYYLTIILTPIICCWIVGRFHWPLFLVGITPSLMLLGLADHLHKQFHLDGSPYEGRQWFSYLRALHWHHHQPNMRKNYAIGDFWLDWVLLGIRFH